MALEIDFTKDKEGKVLGLRKFGFESSNMRNVKLGIFKEGNMCIDYQNNTDLKQVLKTGTFP